MADELQVQQGKSATPYVAVGAAAGAAVGGLGANFITKPKYSSYDEIISEAKDTAKFSSKIEKAEGEEKTFLEAAKEAANKQKEVEDKWDEEFKTYKENHKGEKVVQETPEYKKLVSDYQTAEKALNDKKTELINAEIERLKTKGEKTKTATIEQSLTHKANQILKATRKYEALKEKNAAKEELNAAEQEVKKLQKEATELSEKLAEKLEYKDSAGKDLTGDALKDKKKEVVKAFEDSIQGRANKDMKPKKLIQNLNEEDTKLYKDFIENLSTKEKQQQAIDQSLTKLNNLTGHDVRSISSSNHPSLLVKKLENAIKVENNQIDRLNNLKKAYEKAVKNSKKSGITKIDLLKALLGEPFSIKTPVDVQTALNKYLDKLPETDRKKLQAVFKGNIDDKAIDTAIETTNKRKTAITDTITSINSAYSEIQKIDKQRAAINKNMNKRGVHPDLTKGTLIDNTTGKTVKSGGLTSETATAATSYTLPEGVKEPKDGVKLEYTTGAPKAMTEAELKEKATAAIKAEDYKAQTDAFEAAKTAKDNAYKALPGEEKTEAQLLEDFIKNEKGGKEKSKFVEDAVDENKKKFKDDFKKMFERKYGFEKHTSAKIAGVAAAGAVVLGGLAYLLAPKNKA